VERELKKNLEKEGVRKRREKEKRLVRGSALERKTAFIGWSEKERKIEKEKNR